MKIGVLGAKGSIGRACVNEIAQRGLQATELDKDESIPKGLDVLILAVPGDIAKEISFDGIIIDCSREYPNTELSLPGVTECSARLRYIPNCMASLIAQAVAPLHLECTIRNIIMTTMQSASGAGWRGVRALEESNTGELLELFGGQLTNNILPHENAEVEERSIANDLYTMFGCSVTATAFRAPVHTGHIASLRVETDQPIEASTLPEASLFDPRSMEGKRNVAIGRVRINKNTADFIVCGDQIVCGTAIPAIESIVLSQLGKD